MMTGSSTLRLALAGAGAMAFATPGALAGDLYTQASAGLTGHNAVQFVQADDFMIAGGGVMTYATISIFEIGANQWDGTVQYYLFQDSGGKPSSVLASGLGQNVNQAVTSVNGSGWEFSDVRFDFQVPFTADPGQKYWFGVVLSDTFNDGDQVFWTATSGQVGSRSKSNASQSVPLFAWQNNVFDFGFTLGGEIPTPGSLAAIGVGGLALVRRRRRA